jgi:hypothetical protein
MVAYHLPVGIPSYLAITLLVPCSCNLQHPNNCVHPLGAMHYNTSSTWAYEHHVCVPSHGSGQQPTYCFFPLVLPGAAQHLLLRHPSGITGTVSLPHIQPTLTSKAMIATHSPHTQYAYHFHWPLSYGLPYRNTPLMDSLHTCMQR